MIYFLFGAVIGCFSWGISLSLTLSSLSLFIVYLVVDQRNKVFLFSFAYYLMASRGVFLGVDAYYDNLLYALLSWLIIALLSSLVWTFIWSRFFRCRLYLFPLALLFIIFPPFGFISGVNPLPSIAVLLPSSGFFGLFIELSLIYLLAILLREYGKRVLLLLVATFILSIPFLESNRIMEDDIGIVNSRVAYSPISFDKLKEYQRVKKLFYLVKERNETTLLLPENALGNYGDIQFSMLWSHLDSNRTIYAGATIYNSRYSKNINVLMELNSHGSKILYKQRVPLIIEMWKPFTSRGTEATLYKQPIVEVGGKKAGVFICYEQLLTYPYLQTLFYHPERLIGLSNLYWARGTNIREVQEETMQLWSLLFGIPLSFSLNV